jgi:DNA-binding MarR family transcriptional regulator
MSLATGAAEIDNEGVELGVLGGLAGYHLRRASSAFAADFARAMAGRGMRQVLFGIISVVAANPGINQGAAGRVLGIQRANMVALINELVGEGLIEREISKDDRRAFSLNLSAKGRAELDDCLARIHVHEEEMLSDLDAADRAKLIALLTRIEAKER